MNTSRVVHRKALRLLALITTVWGPVAPVAPVPPVLPMECFADECCLLLPLLLPLTFFIAGKGWTGPVDLWDDRACGTCLRC